MKSIDYPEAMQALAADQPQYNTLFVNVQVKECDIPPPKGVLGPMQKKMVPWEMIACFELTDKEIEQIIRSKKLYYSQAIMGFPFQPMQIMTESPFTHPVENYLPPVSDNKVSAEEWDKTHFRDPNNEKCLNCGRLWNEHCFSTRQCRYDKKLIIT